MTYNPVGVGPTRGFVVAATANDAPPGSVTETEGGVMIWFSYVLRPIILASGNNVSVNKLSVGGTFIATRTSYVMRVPLRRVLRYTQPGEAIPGVLSAEGTLTP
jgi:hypothetical protein